MANHFAIRASHILVLKQSQSQAPGSFRQMTHPRTPLTDQSAACTIMPLVIPKKRSCAVCLVVRAPWPMRKPFIFFQVTSAQALCCAYDEQTALRAKPEISPSASETRSRLALKQVEAMLVNLVRVSQHPPYVSETPSSRFVSGQAIRCGKLAYISP